MYRKFRSKEIAKMFQPVGVSMTPGSTTVTAMNLDESGKITFAKGATVPTDAEAGYAKGCYFVQTDGGIGTTIYINEGSNTSCDFNAISAGGVTTFTALTDTPANYVGSAYKLLRVNAGATAVEFATADATIIRSLAQGSIIVGDVAGLGSALDAKGDAKILIGNGTTITSQSITGDVSITNLGVATVTDLTITGEAQGDVLYRNATNWVRLAAGVAGQALVTAGAGSNPYWGAPSVATASVLTNSVTCEAGANDYTLIFGAAGGAYNLTVPAVGGSRTFAFIDEAQTFTAIQTFTNEGLHILDTNASHDLIVKAGSDLTADRILTFNTGDAARSITMAGDISIAANFNTVNANALTLTTTGITDVTLPLTGTLATLAGTETLSGKTLTLPQINDTSADHQYVFAVSELAADRNITLPLLTGDDTFVFQAHLQTLTNKTLSGNVATGFVYSVGGNAITFQDAVHTVIGRDTADTLTNKSFDCDGAGNALTNVNANELDPITMGTSTYGVEFTITYNLSNQAAAVNIFNANAPFKFRVIDVYSVSTSADGGTWKLNNGALGAGTDLHNPVTVAASDTDIDRIINLNDAAWEIAQNGSLSIVPDGGGALDCMLFVKCMRVD